MIEIETVEDGYKVDGEVGRFCFNTYRAICNNDCIINTATDVFPVLKGKQWYRTKGFKDIAIFYGDIDNSFRKTTKLINRVRYQQINGTPYRTLQDNTEKEGARLVAYIENKTTNVLRRHSFNEDGKYIGDPKTFEASMPACLSEEIIKNAAADLDGEWDTQEILDNPVNYEDPSKSVNIAIDDVGAKRQIETRTKETKQPDQNKRKYVYNTVIRIDKDEKRYSLVGSGIKATIRYLIAFLFSNSLVACRFQFFTDGHTILNDTITRCFGWYANFGIILDWFHLVKKCKELLSMSMKGRLIRNKSKMGSLALAALTAAKLNGEKNIWMKKGILQFKLSTC